MEYKKKNVWETVKDTTEIDEFSKGYLDFLTQVKTERESVVFFEDAAKTAGFKDLSTVKSLEIAEKFYFNHRGKAFFLGSVNEPLEKGFSLAAAHIDVPRLDLKSQPLYEEEGVVLLKTHYYGGIKKYQWVTMPLALHGVVYRKDGSQLELVIGEKPEDPVFTITDLLPHLAKNQMTEPMNKGIKGEQLNVLVGSRPKVGEKDKEIKSPLKTFILDYLNETYGVNEEDFLRSELEIVPAFAPREVGFDRSLIGGYGQDDRVCAYGLYRAFFDLEKGKTNQLACFFDKEEIGSNGDTGAKSRMIEYLLTLIASKRQENISPLEIIYPTKALSADVNAFEDPSFSGAFDPHNKGLIGHGVMLTKYTGSGGKYDANDASAEYVSEIMSLFNQGKVIYQFGELGKVDEGGGGTIAQHLSELGMETLDMGPGLLSMHSPFEIASKADIYMNYKALKCFFER